jgi:nicotinate-nucleotide pyrophosphorylase
VLEKYAVRVWRRLQSPFPTLSDGILIKDNHYPGCQAGITAAVTAARARAPHTLKI